MRSLPLFTNPHKIRAWSRLRRSLRSRPSQCIAKFLYSVDPDFVQAHASQIIDYGASHVCRRTRVAGFVSDSDCFRHFSSFLFLFVERYPKYRFQTGKLRSGARAHGLLFPPQTTWRLLPLPFSLLPSCDSPLCSMTALNGENALITGHCCL